MHKSPLDRITVASPCLSDWRWMYGNDRVRFCGQCNLNVYNLSEMTREQAEDLIRNTEGRLCVRFYRRADGTILTQNCPVGLRAVREKVSRARTHILGALLSILSFLGFLDAYKFATWGQVTANRAARIEKPGKGRVVTGVVAFSYEPPSVRRSEGFIRQNAVYKVTPVYHSNGSRRVFGDAVVKIIVTKDGEVESAEMVEGDPRLKDLVETAARGWGFKSLMGDYAKVESQLTFHFGR